MRNDATSNELREDRATQKSRDECASLGDAVLAGLSLPVWVLDVSCIAARSASSRGADGGSDDAHGRFLNDITVLAANPAALALHKAASATDLSTAREQHIFPPALLRAIVAAMSDAPELDHHDVEIELGGIDGAAQRVRARVDFFTTDAGASCGALTILPSRHSSLMRAIPDIVFELDAHGVYVDFAGPDDALLAPISFIGKSITETMPADVADRALASLARLRERGGSERFEYALSMSDGLHWYEASLRALPSGGAAAHVRDVTDLKSAEWRCQECEERCRTLDAELQARTLELERVRRELESLGKRSDEMMK